MIAFSDVRSKKLREVRNLPSDLIINSNPAETRVALTENGLVKDLIIERFSDLGLVGNIYRGKVLRVLPGMQACFVEVGLERTAFLYAGDVRDPNAPSEDFLVDEEPGDEEVNERPKQKIPIQDLIKDGQEILVQVAKEPMGTKGARITMNISLPGRHLVYMPTVKHVGISRRIADEAERKRLRDVVESFRPPEGGFIVRTACEGVSAEAIKADMEFLTALWKKIQDDFKSKSGPGSVHKELDMDLRVIRDMVNEDVRKIIVDEVNVASKVKSFIEQFMPRFKDKHLVEIYSGEEPIFDHFGIEVEIARALGRKVWLKSGGYIVIDEAEALVAVDVNTGRYVGKRNLEDTILKTNLEAVKEIAYQLRLRNCGGIIIIDFIDMEREPSREKVFNALKEELQKDRAKTNVLGMSGLGLIEMTRKRTRESLVRALCEPCNYCDGKGYLKSKSSISYDIFRALQREGKSDGATVTYAHMHPDLADWIYNEEREMLEKTEESLGHRIIIKGEEDFHIEQYEIFSKH